MKLILTLLCALASTAVFAKAQVRFDEVQESAWSKDFAAIYKKSKTYGDLLKNLPTMTSLDAEILSRILNPNDPLPKMELKGNTFVYENNVTLKIISLNDYSFSINGKSFKYDPHQSLVYNMKVIDSVLAKKTSLYDFFLPQAYAEELNTDLLRFWENFSPIEIYSIGASFAASGLLKNVIAGKVITPVHHMVTIAESYFTPNCSQQAIDLMGILEQNHIGLADLNCGRWRDDGMSVGANAKTVTFWTDKKTKKQMNADWINGIAWDDPNHLYMFDQTKLIEYREVNPNQDPNNKISPKISSYEIGSSKFEAARKEIEPYRQVLKYMGDNKTCYKCHNEVKKELVKSKPPASHNSTSDKESSASSAK